MLVEVPSSSSIVSFVFTILNNFKVNTNKDE